MNTPSLLLCLALAGSVAVAGEAVPAPAPAPETQPGEAKPRDVEELIEAIPLTKLGDPKIILEAGGIKVPVSAVEKVELAYVAVEKRRQPRFTLTPELKKYLRKRFAFRFLTNALVSKFVADNKFELPQAQFEEQFRRFKQAKVEEGEAGSYEQWLADNGLTDEEFREFWRANWAIEQHNAKAVTDADVEKALTDMQESMGLRRVSHILVMFQGPEEPQVAIRRSREEAKARAEEALKKLQAGEKFETLVSTYSDCPSRAEKGQLGHAARKGGPTEVFGAGFNEAAYKVEKVGEVSPLVESKYGYHIIRLDEVRKPEEMKREMRQFLISEKYRKQMEQLINAAAVGARFNEEHF